MTGRRWSLAAALLLGGGAAKAELCYGPAHDLTTVQPATAATVFQCPKAGSGTLSQLAARGWRVVKLTPLQVSGGATPQAADQLLLQRYDRVFRSGFE